MRIYVDISNFTKVNFLTGIQRVVREILLRMIKNDNYELCLVVWNPLEKKYFIVNLDSFKNFINTNNRNNILITNIEWDFTVESSEESVFLDMDGVWNEDNKRNTLYSILKSNNYRIFTLVYDVIPILYSQYCNQNTLYRFMDYLTGVLKYTDVILTNTENTKKDIKELMEKTNIESKKIEILPLGADFQTNCIIKDQSIQKEALKAVSKGKYILTVGTIEPRKNHQYLLDYFDKYCDKNEINIIIAGREGWNVSNFMQRLKTHPAYNKRIFFIEKANDTTIDYLYKNAFIFVFPSYYEGYGLPIIEALSHGIITAVSDINVFKEIGKQYCDYISLNDLSSLNTVVKKYLNNEKCLIDRKKELANFNIPRWDETIKVFDQIIRKYKSKTLKLNNILEQVYILTARENGLRDTLNSIDKLMPFIKKVLVQCPQDLKKSILGNYSGRLQIDIISDEELLNGQKLPTDHQERNFFLRSLAIKGNKVDKQFIMYDDDYVPLVEIRRDDYIEDNVYKAYYFYEMQNWKGALQVLTSYDIGVFNTYDWLVKNGYPTKQYSAHMPQIINRDIFLEMLNEHPEVKGVCEWSSYFNYAFYKYPNNFKSLPYKTLCWPGLPSDWHLGVEPDEFLFENRYPEFYRSNGIFSKFKNNFDDYNNIRAVLEKIHVRQKIQNKYQKNCALQKGVAEVLKVLLKKDSIFYLNLKKENQEFIVPELLCSLKDLWNKYDFNILNKDNISKENWDLTYKFYYVNLEGNFSLCSSDIVITNKPSGYEIAIKTPNHSGKYDLHIILSSKKNKIYFHKVIPVIIIDE